MSVDMTWPIVVLAVKVLQRNSCFATVQVAIEKAIYIAEKNGLRLIEQIDFEYGNKVVHWNEIDLDFTFIFFAMRKE